MTNLIALRNKHKEEFEKSHGVKLGFMSAFVRVRSLLISTYICWFCTTNAMSASTCPVLTLLHTHGGARTHSHTHLYTHSLTHWHTHSHPPTIPLPPPHYTSLTLSYYTSLTLYLTHTQHTPTHTVPHLHYTSLIHTLSPTHSHSTTLHHTLTHPPYNTPYSGLHRCPDRVPRSQRSYRWLN